MEPKFFILVRITKHWLVWTRSEGKQIYTTREAADEDARALRGRTMGLLNKPIYADVLVKELKED